MPRSFNLQTKEMNEQDLQINTTLGVKEKLLEQLFSGVYTSAPLSQTHQVHCSPDSH